jgi:two-component system, response regulator RegA
MPEFKTPFPPTAGNTRNASSPPGPFADPPRVAAIFDDDQQDACKLAGELRNLGIESQIRSALDVELDRLQDKDLVRRAYLIVVDPWPRSVAEATRAIRRTNDHASLVVVSRAPSLAEAFHAGAAKASAYFPKPVTAEGILGTTGSPAVPTYMSLDRNEWEYVNWVLLKSAGNKSEAARRLGIRRSVLQRKLIRLPPAR